MENKYEINFDSVWHFGWRCCYFPTLGHNLIQAHMFTVGAGWAIFSMGMAFGLALALAVLYFEIIIRSFK